MYSMNWETYSFTRVRHVPMHGTLLGGQFIATVHFMQRYRLPQSVEPTSFRLRKIKKETTYMQGG